MRPARFLFPIAATLLLCAQPGAAHAQSMEKSPAPAMGAMKDSSAAMHDGTKATMSKSQKGKAKEGMAKQGMAKEGMGTPTKAMHDKAKAPDAMQETGAMAEPAKMSQP
jgi:hypothetical protein